VRSRGASTAFALLALTGAGIACGGPRLARTTETGKTSEETMTRQEGRVDFDALWDYDDPAATEAKFRELLPAARASGDLSYLLQLETQIARTQGLQRDFEGAHRTLDAVEARLPEGRTVERVRYLLERGRTLNSSKHPEEAKLLFIEAWDTARAVGADGFAVDAAHMVAIVETPEGSLRWNEKAIAYAEASGKPEAARWLGSLYNNTGWTLHDQGEYERALGLFEKALALREKQAKAGPIRIARWCVARTLRSLERYDEALGIQEELERECAETGESDGYVQEELGELYLVAGRVEEAKPHFARAYEILSQDAWLMDSEPERVARLKELGGL